MSKKARTVKKYTAEAVKKSEQLSRDDYKRIKHMDKVTMAAYLDHLFFRGYQAGYEAAKQVMSKEDVEGSEMDADE